MEIIEFIKELAVGKAFELWGMIFAVVLLASLIEYKLSGKPERKSMGVLGGALLGLVPGCGGTIAVTSLYTKRKASFSAVLASFVATLGDGSFPLITINFKAFVIVSVVGFFLGLIIGYGYDAIIPEANKPTIPKKANVRISLKEKPINSDFQSKLLNEYLFWPLITLGIIFFPLSLLNVISSITESLSGNPLIDSDLITGNGFVIFIGVASMILVTVYWLLDITLRRRHDCRCRSQFKEQIVHGLRDAAMIMALIILSTILLELIIQKGIGEDEFTNFISKWGIMLVIFAAFMGALPGCAPFVILVSFVGTVYANGEGMLWGVLLAGTIATSGDGIFGLVAASRKTAFYVTGISIGLAIIIGLPTFLIFG